MCGIIERGSHRTSEPVGERLSIADSLHDGALQELAGMSLKLAALASNASLSPGELRSTFWELQGATQAVIDELHEVVRRLSGQPVSPTAEPETGDLATELRSLCQAFTRESRIPCLYTVSEELTRLRTPAARVLCRSVRELLNNVRKHASASLVEIGGRRREDGLVEIRVKDDGVGPPADAPIVPPYEGGYGLWSIAQSLAEIGGRLEVDGHDGFCARLLIPDAATLTS